MPLVLVGIDEAGYGPLLGPLTVAGAALRVESWSEGDAAPDLWTLLSGAVCREARDPRSRLPVADSKRLKLANSVTTRHPLIHLEGAPLALLKLMHGQLPSDCHHLFTLLGVDLGAPSPPWYAGSAQPLPVGRSAPSLSIHANLLGGVMDRAGVEPLGLWCRALGERTFNTIISQTGTKAGATASVIGEYLRHAFECWGDGSRGSLRVVCDRQGGRTSYAPMIAREVRGAGVTVMEESARCSQYEVKHRARRMVVTFMPEAESAHLPVALASMVAKLVRELSMARFNAYWCARAREVGGIELKPTAGYRQDAARWLEDAKAIVSPEERLAMIRIA